ncbi:STAS domain-containing protein [Phaeovibrio sulfidiphilus]|uniref:Anti-sigma factor antagonist n=1 Tax=Phaeovibrio sulfidiphilus TaxID=1220600 RepID=A0A8J6YI43_9PROT|nr:STAS domain-containing protein [Phaeovibrio sulfidiphilus]MBE1236651.1 STAS domain-containing protein [Phaeovibrio sulfidiphilus]
MSCSVTSENGIATVTLTGEIDGQSAPSIQDELLKVLPGEGKVLVDFSRVTFLSSAGLRLLLVLTRAVRGGGGTLVLAGVIDPIREVMEQTGFLTHLTLVPTLSDGLAELDAASAAQGHAP